MPRLRFLMVRHLYGVIAWTVDSPWIPAWLKQWISLFCEQTAWLLEFEPSWFAEFGLAVGAAGWGFCNIMTDDYAVHGSAVILPVCAMVGGLLRCFVLLRLWYAPRVIMAGASALLWAWLWWGLATYYGWIGMLGLLSGVFLIDVLTAAKFSLPCARELRDDFLAWRHAR